MASVPNDRKKADGQGGLTHTMSTCAGDDVLSVTCPNVSPGTDIWNGACAGLWSIVGANVPAKKVPADVITSMVKAKY
jgi:hypothetical protein